MDINEKELLTEKAFRLPRKHSIPEIKIKENKDEEHDCFEDPSAEDKKYFED